jgi:excisionase family DNA binding protein
VKTVVVSDAKFRAVWRMYDGSTTALVEHLHIGDRRVWATARRLGLKRAGYLNAVQAARLLGLSAPRVHVLCEQGILPAMKIHGRKRSHWKITRAAVLEFRGEVPMLALRPYEVEDGYLTTDDLAARLGYTRDGVRRLCWLGAIRAHKTARGDFRIPQAEADRIDAEVREQGFVVHRVAPAPEQPRVKEMLMYPTDFPSLLRFYVERSGRTATSIAHTADITPSALTRAMTGKRGGMVRTSVDALAAALCLTDTDHGRLLVAAGFAPRPFLVLGYDETFDTVASTLADLDESERAAYREQIVTLTAQYRRRRNGLMGLVR